MKLKHLKKFELFESVELNIDDVTSLYEDIKSIGYLLEEEGINLEYRLRVVCVPYGTLQKEIRTILITNSNDIKNILSQNKTILKDFLIIIKDRKNNDRTVSFTEEVEIYWDLLRLHLNYVTDKHIKKNIFYSNGKIYEISISSNLFT